MVMQSTVTEATLSRLENTASALLSNDSVIMNTPIITKKYQTQDNRLVYLTECNIAEIAVPRLRVQILERVDGGVNETSYALYADQRFECTKNPMIFGDTSGPAETSTPTAVDEDTAEWLIQLIQSLAAYK
jgi:hypothetical protein